jgi:Lrp/AsnC family leucine-responsive transcriptional regulator
LIEKAMDDIDKLLVALLSANARTPFTELAEAVGLSGPSTADRVRRLEERGVVRGYSARVDPVALGRGLTAFIAVSVAGQADTRTFLDDVAALPDVVECHHVAGSDDYLLKVHVAGTGGLEAFITDRLKGLPAVASTRSTVVLSTPIDRPLTVAPD